MNKRARIEKAIKGERVDKIPWTIYKSLLPWGEEEFKLRFEGLSMIYEGFPACNILMSDVEVIDKSKYIFRNNRKKNVLNREFSTPVGKVSIIYEYPINTLPQLSDIPARFGVSDVAQRELSWITKYPFESESDYERLEYIYDNTKYIPIDEEYVKVDKIVGDEGIIMLNVGRSPFSLILFSLMGYEKCYIEYYDNRKKFFRFFEFLYQKLKEQYILAAESSAYVVWCPDNITSDLIPPDIFKEFFVPFYNDVADILHNKDKVLVVHMDGSIKSLIDLLGETKIDVIEAFTPPPMGDLSVAEARTELVNKVIWINFPGTLIACADSKTIEDYTISLIKEAAPGKRFLIGCTENFPLDNWELAFRAIAKVLKKFGKYPISF